MKENRIIKKALFIVGAVFLPLSLTTLCACSDEESTSGPNSKDDPTPHWNARYGISLDESKKTISYHITYKFGSCNIASSNETKWVEDSIYFNPVMQYSINGNELRISFLNKDGSTDEIETVYTGNTGGSILGFWESTTDSNKILITRDSVLTTEYSVEKVPAAESAIQLANSTFIYDLYRCGAKDYTCTFSHWHLTKDASDLIQEIIATQGITILESRDRFQRFTFNGKEITISVEHVQIKSSNNEDELYQATVKSKKTTCTFEHATQTMTQELCSVKNMDYITPSAYEDEEGNVYSEIYLKDNSSEFAQCVSKILSSRD